MIKLLLIFVGLNGALATALAAYASHHPSLQGQTYLLSVFDKANHQHFVHLLACLAALVAAQNIASRWWLYSACLFGLGFTLFSYPLYLFALTGVKIAGFLTPIGGGCFILGWLCISIAALQGRVRDNNI